MYILYIMSVNAVIDLPIIRIKIITDQELFVDIDAKSRQVEDVLQEILHVPPQIMKKRQLPTFTTSDPTEDKCPICLEHLKTRRITKTSCAHLFHQDCINKWLGSNTKSSCALCRALPGEVDAISGDII